ncbi:MAG: T9SS type A sorting domain-containing protein, partial [Bacteroidia bacterium]
MAFRKRILIALLFCFCSPFAKAQFVSIPDTNFVNWLNNNGYSSCMNGNQLNSSCLTVQSTTHIDCSNAGILDLSGINAFSNLVVLDCGSNLNISIPSLPNSLLSFSCRYSNLTILPTLPSNLTELNVVVNNLSSLPFLPNSIEYLAIIENEISYIFNLPSNLKVFYCDDNEFVSLPQLPNSLEYLYCSSNLLTTLPTLPDSLRYLDCSYNFLTSLPFLPNKLSGLDCSDNNLTSINALPPKLGSLDCSYNGLNSLPVFPSSMYSIDCNQCGLTFIANLPDTLSYLIITNNPNLKCIPSTKIIGQLYWGNTGITCIPNNVLIINSTPSAQNLPLCNWNNVNNCHVGETISGTVFKDDNLNCNLDTLEIKYPMIKINLLSSGTLVQQAYTNQFGNYSFGTNAGTFEITADTSNSNYQVNCPVQLNYTVIIDSLNPLESNKNFSISCKPGFDLSASSINSDSGIFRPGGLARIGVVIVDNNLVVGLNCASGISGLVKVVLHGPVNYISPSQNSLLPLVVGDTLIYSVSDFGLINPLTSFRFNVQVDTSVVQNQQVCVDVFVDTIVGDFNFSNNNLFHCFNVVNSYDPNDKTVFPSGLIDSSQHWLTYTIRFQNTGNAPANFVSILDSLDSNLDESTFQLLAFSHEPEVQIVGSRLKFDFININLPDSVSDEPNSHGYIQYKVKRDSSLSIGSTIHNTASIYFDYNFPITTNTTYNQLIDPSNLVLIPDINFVSWLNSNGYANCMYGNLLDTTCSLVSNTSNLNCYNSSISDLTGIRYFKQLDTLICSNNNLVTLPVLPPFIMYINCSVNSITTNFSWPISLKYLDCGSNLLQTLQNLPVGLTDLRCNENQLSSLPVIPTGLKYLDCHANQISMLSILPNTLKQIYIQDNQLAAITNLPDTMISLNISNNPSLNCLPKFMKITGNLNWNGTGINCLPNILNAAIANPSLSGVPVCNYFNSNNCIPYPNLKGVTYADANGNCIYNVNENKFENVKINLIKAGVVADQTYSDSNGNYSFIANDLGSYFNEVDTFNLPFRVNCPTTFRYLSNLTFWNPFFENRDFSLYCKPGFDVGVNSIHRDSGIFMAGTIGQVSVVAGDLSKKFNLNCATGVSGSVKVILSGPVLFTSPSAGAMVPVVNGDTLIYTVANFWNVDINTAFNFLVQTAPSALLGDQICFSVFVSPTSGDSYFENNSYSHCFPVVNSMLSNVKEVSPTNQVDTSEYWLTYTINYQNVSGSLAQNMHIMDTLDLQLNKNTFELVGHSHPVQVQVRSNRILFYYSNINLPDSSVDQETSRGFIQYKVKRYNNLPIGTQIQNTAYIYFDFNPPVQTNTTTNEIAVTSGVGVGEYQNPILFSIFPNPISSGQILNIYFNSSEKKKAELSVYDLSGRKLYAQFVNASEQSQTISLPYISPGVYLVVLNDGKHQAQQKLIV